MVERLPALSLCNSSSDLIRNKLVSCTVPDVTWHRILGADLLLMLYGLTDESGDRVPHLGEESSPSDSVTC